MFVFRLWNKILDGEIVRFDRRDRGWKIDSLLQPREKYKCASMLLLFGTVPSFYSLHCNRFESYKGPMICKKRLETWRQPPHHVGYRNDYTICQANEVFAISNCFAVEWELNVLLLNETPVAHDVQKYFNYIFSFLVLHTSSRYQLLMKAPFTIQDENDYCTYIKVTPGLPYDISRRIVTYKSRCRPYDSYRKVFIKTIGVEIRVHCQANQVTCEDGTCISHIFSCGHNCHPLLCSCQMRGMRMMDQNYCFNICLPTNCICPNHYFQCTSGGCIHMSAVCDGVIHCLDLSDEICETKIRMPITAEREKEALLSDRFFCLAFLCHSGQCIHLRNVNDLMPDCPGGKAEDEPLFLQLRYNGKFYNCEDSTEIPCVPGLPVCFTLQQMCLYDSDDAGNPRWCRNGAHLGDCSLLNCTNSYKCPGSYCIPFHRVCDGYLDCIHGHDEEQCHDYICKGLLRCVGTKICVHPTHVCDGVRNCPSGEDEELCDMTFCPHDCTCLSYSIMCILKTTETIPTMPSKLFRHISIILSHMTYPEFYNIRDQLELVFLNLTRNHIENICVPLQQVGRYYEKLTILDLSHNDIISLQPDCFARLGSMKMLFLGYNPLHMLPPNSLSSLSVAYISLRGSQVKSLYGYSFSKAAKLCYLDISENYIVYLDNYATDILSQYFDLKFDDSRLCCIFTQNKYCIEQAMVTTACPNLLPHGLIGYFILPFGVGIVFLNLIAFNANRGLAKASLYCKITSFLILTDAMLASYLPMIGAADLYYKSDFVLVEKRWHWDLICWLIENMSIITTIVSPFLSGLLLFLTSLGITKVKVNVSDNSFLIIFFAVVATLAAICFSLCLTILTISSNASMIKRGYTCNMMGHFNVTSRSGISFTITLSILMLTFALWITTSVTKSVLYMKQATKDVQRITKMKLNSQRAKEGVGKFMISLIIMKLFILLPYPLLQAICIFSGNVPEIVNLCVMLLFIVMECSLNPIAFVLRPYLIKGNRTPWK